MKELTIIKAGFKFLGTTQPAAVKGTLSVLQNQGWISFKTLNTVNGVAIYGKKN